MAGEVGHMAMRPFGPVGYGKAGSFEGFCSGGGIAQLARSRAMEALQMGGGVGYCPDPASLDGITARSVAEAARQGDPAALEVYRTSGELLGEGLSILIDVLNPETIVIGSIFARAHDLLWPAAESVIRRQSLSYAREVCRWYRRDSANRSAIMPPFRSQSIRLRSGREPVSDPSVERT